MKIRTDFVTNSSSSSFIISRKEELTEKQKEAIISFALKTFLGSEEVTTENLEDMDLNPEEEAQITTELENGNVVYSGYVSFEEGADEVAYMYHRFWRALKRADPEHFTEISTDLMY